MTSGQWDLTALEALEREALEVVDVLEVPAQVRRCQPVAHFHHMQQHPPYYHSQVFHRYAKQNQDLHHSTQPNRHVNQTVGCQINDNYKANLESGMQIEIKDHIKHCSCNCNHMGYGNFMDYQVCFHIISSNYIIYNLSH